MKSLLIRKNGCQGKRIFKRYKRRISNCENKETESIGRGKMMNSGILFQQLLVLMALMATGFVAYKTKLVDSHTHSQLSSLMVWILNPFMMISGVIGKNDNISSEFIVQNVAMVGIMYGFLFLTGFAYIALMRYKGKTGYLYRLVMLFPNVGFMGVPLVKEMFGNEYVVYVAFYMLGFNILCYTYGIHLSARLGGNTEKFQWKKLISPGMVTAIMSILIFFLHLELPDPIVSYVNYLGTSCIAFSMIIIGISLGKLGWKDILGKKDYYIFTVVKMLLIPILYVFLSRFLPFDPVVIGVFQIMICMPVASMTCMFAQEYGGDGSECAKMISLTTLVTVVTAPLVIMLVG